MRVLIIGCGYVGLPLGVELLRQGHEVFGVRRSAGAAESLKAAGIQPVIADIAKQESLAALPGTFDWVVNLVSSSKGGPAEYKAVYVEGTRHLIEWLSAHPPKKFVYTSSTSVYGQTDGSVVKETSPTEPASETSRILVEAERMLINAYQQSRFPAVILRVAGIYGPDRGHLLLKYLRNEAKIHGKGDRILNMIHRDDLIGMIILALKSARPGEIYNAVDDEPVPEIHFFRWLSETLGRWMPPFHATDELPERKRGVTNKRVSNRKVRMELGYICKYPNFRQGYTAEIDRMEKAGLI